MNIQPILDGIVAKLQPLKEKYGNPEVRNRKGPATAFRHTRYDLWDTSDANEDMPGWFIRLIDKAYGLIGVYQGNGEWYVDYEVSDNAKKFQEEAIEIVDDILVDIDWFD